MVKDLPLHDMYEGPQDSGDPWQNYRDLVPDNEALIRDVTDELMAALDVYTEQGGNSLTHVGLNVDKDLYVDSEIIASVGRVLHRRHGHPERHVSYGTLKFTLSDGTKLKLSVEEELD